jgi:hypothetical protein
MEVGQVIRTKLLIIKNNYKHKEEEKAQAIYVYKLEYLVLNKTFNYGGKATHWFYNFITLSNCQEAYRLIFSI